MNSLGRVVYCIEREVKNAWRTQLTTETLADHPPEDSGLGNVKNMLVFNRDDGEAIMR